MSDLRRFVLWGSSGHAKVLAEAITLLGGCVVALFDNSEIKSSLSGVPVYKGESQFCNWAGAQGKEIQNISGLVAIGGAGGRDRLAIQELFHRYGLFIPVIRHPSAVISSSSYLGAGTQILALSNISSDVQSGEACIVNHRASVDHECRLGNGVHIAPGAVLCGCVTVADNVFVGAGAIILPRLSIGANSIIGAGAVVTRDVPEGVTVVGNPAKIISSIS
jgi:sugar O-acyltransferase (sialic acid O-acetyltransferase NeuD family)